MTEGATERLSRLLTMVPWLLTHQGVELSDAAAEFGVDEAQLVKDLELLFVCGTPGHLPDDLIEAEWEGGRVFVDNADSIARPLRLGVDEALALLVGLRTLAEVPGLGERAAVDRALAKLEAAAGAAAAGAQSVHVALEAGAEAEVLAAAREALAGHRRLRLDYLVPSRDETTRRDVDPMRVQTVEARWYLEAWCHRAEAVRLFRLDRIVGIEVLDEDGTPPPQARSRDLDEQLFSPGPDDLTVTLELAAVGPLGRGLLPGRLGGGAGRRPPARAAAHRRHPVAAAPGPPAVRPGPRARARRAGRRCGPRRRGRRSRRTPAYRGAGPRDPDQPIGTRSASHLRCGVKYFSMPAEASCTGKDNDPQGPFGRQLR